MDDDCLFVRLEMWLEKEDGEIKGVSYNYSLPKIDNELTVELYKLLIETLCNEISTLEGAENLLSLEFEAEDNT